MFMTRASSVLASKNDPGGPSTMYWPPVRSDEEAALEAVEAQGHRDDEQ